MAPHGEYISIPTTLEQLALQLTRTEWAETRKRAFDDVRPISTFAAHAVSESATCLVVRVAWLHRAIVSPISTRPIHKGLPKTSLAYAR